MASLDVSFDAVVELAFSNGHASRGSVLGSHMAGDNVAVRLRTEYDPADAIRAGAAHVRLLDGAITAATVRALSKTARGWEFTLVLSPDVVDLSTVGH